jgi:hypothetical protein
MMQAEGDKSKDAQGGRHDPLGGAEASHGLIPGSANRLNCDLRSMELEARRQAGRGGASREETAALGQERLQLAQSILKRAKSGAARPLSGLADWAADALRGLSVALGFGRGGAEVDTVRQLIGRQRDFTPTAERPFPYSESGSQDRTQLDDLAAVLAGRKPLASAQAGADKRLPMMLRMALRKGYAVEVEPTFTDEDTGIAIAYDFIVGRGDSVAEYERAVALPHSPGRDEAVGRAFGYPPEAIARYVGESLRNGHYG